MQHPHSAIHRCQENTLEKVKQETKCNKSHIKREPGTCFELYRYITKYLSSANGAKYLQYVSLLSSVKNNMLRSLKVDGYERLEP